MSQVSQTFPKSRRYRYPFAQSHPRTIISGRVSFPRILDMLKLRCSGEWTSIIASSPFVLPED
jgi:hypothetical protein